MQLKYYLLDKGTSVRGYRQATGSWITMHTERITIFREDELSMLQPTHDSDYEINLPRNKKGISDIRVRQEQLDEISKDVFDSLAKIYKNR